MPTPHPDFDAFLRKTFGQKETSLVIAQNEAELEAFRKPLEQAGFLFLERLTQKTDAPYYAVLRDPDGFKDAHDFAAQSPLGQIQLWDRVQSKAVLLTPNPAHPTVFLLTAETLEKMQQAGMDLLSKVGLTYRT